VSAGQHQHRAGERLAEINRVQGSSDVFGGLTGCRHSGNELRLDLNEEAQATFGWPREIVLTVDVDVAAIKRLRKPVV
jgi:hypothetical protein